MNRFSRGFTQIHADHFQILSAPNRVYPRLILFCLIFLSAGAVFAQSNLDELKTKIAVGSSEEKRNALYEIRNLHSNEASRLAVPAISDKDEIVRATAASSVIFLPPEESVKLLLALLDDKAPFVRRETAYALGEVSDLSASAALIRILENDGDGEVRSAAAVAIGKIGDVSAVEKLSAILRKKPAESDEMLRRSAARSIGQIAQILRSGRRGVVTPQNLLPAKYKEIEAAKFDDLTTQFPVFRNAVEVLTRVLQNRKEADDTRREAAFALGAIGDRSSIAVLQANVNNGDTYLTEICKEALLKLQLRQ